MSARAWLAGGIALLCVGCGGLLTSRATPEQTYYLRAPAVAGAAPLAASVRVNHPQADPGLDSPRITLRQSDHRMSFYSGARWAAPVPDVLEALAVQTLRAQGAWSSVGDSASPFPADYVLLITVRRFDADYGAGGAAPDVRVVLECVLARREAREVVTSFSVEGSATAGANRQAAVVAAFEQATGAALQGLAAHSLEAAAADLPQLHAAQNAETPTPSSTRPSQ